MQQLDANLVGADNTKLLVAGMGLASVGAEIPNCEVDVVGLLQGYGTKVEVLLGECKTNGEITGDEVTKLSRAADAFPGDRFETYILFSKTGTFTSEEITRCATARVKYRSRVILWSKLELEPYFALDEAKKQYDLSSVHGSDLPSFARATNLTYFEPTFL